MIEISDRDAELIDLVKPLLLSKYSPNDWVVDDLGGTEAGAIVVRISSPLGEDSVVAKFCGDGLPDATVCGRLGSDCFAPVLAHQKHSGWVVFADVGRVSMGDELRGHSANGAELARRYIDAVAKAQTAMNALATPGQWTSASIAHDVGFSAVSIWPADAHRSIVRALIDLGITRGSTQLSEALAKEAEESLRRKIALICCEANRWILEDSNPFNLMLRGTECIWVDAKPAFGLPETNLLALGGAAFQLEPGRVAQLSQGKVGILDSEGIMTLNGLFSLFSLADTGFGLRDGSRNGAQDYDMNWEQVVTFSLDNAKTFLSLGWSEAGAIVDLIERLGGV